MRLSLRELCAAAAQAVRVWTIYTERAMVHAARNEGSAVMAPYSSLPNKLVSAANSIVFAYRDTGEGTEPLVLLQHFRGNLDNWDPALIDVSARLQPDSETSKDH